MFGTTSGQRATPPWQSQHEGVPLASETPTHFLYVVERTGRLLVASKTDQEPSVMRHSSIRVSYACMYSTDSMNVWQR